jgi:hypothetical protein
LMAADSSGSVAGISQDCTPYLLVAGLRQSAISEERNNVGRMTILLRSGMIQGRTPVR